MNKIIRLLLACALVAKAQACRKSEKTNFKAGDKTWVCITIGATQSVTGQQFNYTRFAFNPDMDDFTLLKLSNSFTSAAYSSDELMTQMFQPGAPPTNSELWMHVESEGKFSYQKVFRRGGVVFPLAVAVVSVKDGEVDGISWDFGCFDCTSDKCTTNTFKYNGDEADGSGEECYSEDVDCVKTDTETGVVTADDACSLGVYVTWSGTDAKGNYLLSQQKRLSNFKKTVV